MAFDFTLPEKYYVATKERTGFDTTTFPLGFATPFGTDKAFQKRKETVDSWAGINTQFSYTNTKDANGKWEQIKNPLPPHQGVAIIDNVPVEGFSFDKAVSRWSTSNKWFRIQDPRGFTLEISSDNLADVILNSSISKGFLIGEYVWARHSGNNYLLRTDHPVYLDLTKVKSADELKIEIGDVIKTKAGQLKYFGKFFFMNKKEDWEYDYGSGFGSPRSAYSSGSYGNSSLRQRRIATKYARDEKPWHVFRHFGKDSEYYNDYLVVMRTLPKKFDKITSYDSARYTQLQMPTAEWCRTNDYKLGKVKAFPDKKSLLAYPLPETEYKIDDGS